MNEAPSYIETPLSVAIKTLPSAAMWDSEDGVGTSPSFSVNVFQDAPSNRTRPNPVPAQMVFESTTARERMKLSGGRPSWCRFFSMRR